MQRYVIGYDINMLFALQATASSRWHNVFHALYEYLRRENTKFRHKPISLVTLVFLPGLLIVHCCRYM